MMLKRKLILDFPQAKLKSQQISKSMEFCLKTNFEPLLLVTYLESKCVKCLTYSGT